MGWLGALRKPTIITLENDQKPLNDFRRNQMKNPLLTRPHELKNAKLHAAFPMLLSESSSSTLSLHKYISDVPERFYSQSAFAIFYQKLNAIDATH